MNKQILINRILLIVIAFIVFNVGVNASGHTTEFICAYVEIEPLDGAVLVRCYQMEQPTPTSGPATRTPTPTPLPGPTNTPEPTSTPEPSHSTSVWHEPADGHHHGANPYEVHPEISAFLANPVFAEIGHPWLSSPTENDFPNGKHVGFKNLAETSTTCQTDIRGGSYENCVKAYLYQVHTTGIGNEWRTRVHSFKLVALVCEAGGVNCDIVATGGHHDYGTRHNAYKTEICPLPDNPPLQQDHALHQPPYIATNGTGGQRFRLDWSSLINQVSHYAFDPVPNRLIRMVWNEEAWSVAAAGDACLDPGQDEITGRMQTKFQVFTMRVEVGNFPRPFNGFTDVHGNLNSDCIEIGPGCVPLYIGANVPVGSFILNRSVNPTGAPVQIYGEDADLEMPVHP